MAGPVTMLIDEDDLRNVEARHPDALQGTLVAFDPDLHGALRRAGVDHVTPWDFVGGAAWPQLELLTKDTWAFWRRNARCDFMGVDLLQMLSYRHRACLARLSWASFAARRVLEAVEPSEVVAFHETFPPARRIADRIRYTGYVVEPSAGRDDGGGVGEGEVIVSAGGGALSEPLFRSAMAARRYTRLKDAPWRLLAGHALPEDVFRSLHADAPDGVIVERARPDFTALLSRCALSISQGGYNTVMDLLAAGARGVIVPYAGGAETEQTLRADRLGARGVLQVVRETDLAPERLARSAEAALDRPPANAAGLDVNGAENSAQILAGLVRGRGRPSP